VNSPSRAFTFTDRVETLEYRRGDDLFRFGVTWQLHVRLHVDADLRTAGGRHVEGEERRAVVAETLAYLRTQARGPIEVIGEPRMGDEVRYTVAALGRRARWSWDPFARNTAIHELKALAGEDAARVWYRVVRKDRDPLCVTSALHQLLAYAGVWMRRRPLLLGLTDSAPGSQERKEAMAYLDALLNERDPGLASRLRRSRFTNRLFEIAFAIARRIFDPTR
jgi:hypothetical protein